MMSRPVPAPRTNAGKQVAKSTLEKVYVTPEGTSTSPQKSMSIANNSSRVKSGTSDMPVYPQNNMGSTKPIVATDLNLTALISEVERDIWLLEQLENNSSTKRALQNPLELPFPVTEEILNLPGYKPGRNNKHSEGSAQNRKLDAKRSQSIFDQNEKSLSTNIETTQSHSSINPSHLLKRDVHPLKNNVNPSCNSDIHNPDEPIQTPIYSRGVITKNPTDTITINNNLFEAKEYDHEHSKIYNDVSPSLVSPSSNAPSLPTKKKSITINFKTNSRHQTESNKPASSQVQPPFEESPTLITDIVHQRLLPKDNCVTNILYARRLPSPPVFRRKYSQEQPKNLFARDDQFVEKRSLETSCFSPNRRYCNNPYEEIESGNGVTNAPLLYCPLCINNFGYSFGLECHLLSAHQDVLRVAQNEPHFVQDVLLDRSEWCPCCSAQFLSSGLLIKHLVSVHSEYILNCLDPDFFASRNMQMNPLRQQLHCNFCGQSFQRRHQKMFVQHVENKHIGELEAMLMSKDLLFQNDFSKNDNKFPKSEGKMSMEVKLMLSLSKTVTFSFRKQKHSNKNEKGNTCDNIDVPNSGTLNRKDRFGSLRSSLRRKKSNSSSTSAISKIDLGKKEEIQTVDVKDHQSLLTDKQFVQFQKIPQFKRQDVSGDNDIENSTTTSQNKRKIISPSSYANTPSKVNGGQKSGKRMLRFSIPEVTHQHQNSENEEKIQSRIIGWRDSIPKVRSRSESRSKPTEERRRMKSLERPSNVPTLNIGTRNSHEAIPISSRQPQYHKHNRIEDTSHSTKGTPYVNRSRVPHLSLYQTKSNVFQPQNVPYLPATYRHIPQPEPPPPLFKTWELDSLISQNQSNNQKNVAMKKNSLVSEEEFESLSSASANSSTASTNSSITRKENGDLNFSSRNSLARWSTTKDGNPFIPLQITEQLLHKDENDDGKRLFKCNLCEASFADNVILLGHLKNRHRSSMTKALKPQFSCGVCPAKFFKNSFLIKHCESHERTR